MKQSVNHDKIPLRTVERLLIYRSILSEILDQGQRYIRSHELAELSNNKQELVRRDIMSIQYLGNPAKGYGVEGLLNMIIKKLKLKKPIKVGIVGVGRIGTAILAFFKEQKTRFEITAVFDIDPDKNIGYEKFYPLDKMREIVTKENITIIILSVPPKAAQNIANMLNYTTIKGILNFTHIPLKTKKGILVNNIDIILEMEKLTFFSH